MKFVFSLLLSMSVEAFAIGDADRVTAIPDGTTITFLRNIPIAANSSGNPIGKNNVFECDLRSDVSQDDRYVPTGMQLKIFGSLWHPVGEVTENIYMNIHLEHAAIYSIVCWSNTHAGAVHGMTIGELKSVIGSSVRFNFPGAKPITVK